MAKRGRPLTSFKRSPPKRVAAERVLIVCEGSKTEPQYFNDMIADVGLTSADVVICGKECGTDPVSIVEYAISRASEEEAIDKVFCVFDRDTHISFRYALEKIDGQNQRRKQRIEFMAITSDPCFEYWVLIHHRYSSTSYSAKKGKSVCDCCIDELNDHLPGYAKGRNGLWIGLKDSLYKAIHNSERRVRDAEAEGSHSPRTNMHKLVEALVKLSPLTDDEKKLLLAGPD